MIMHLKTNSYSEKKKNVMHNKTKPVCNRILPEKYFFFLFSGSEIFMIPAEKMMMIQKVYLLRLKS